MDHPTPPWRIVSPEEAAGTIERHERFREHLECLDARWPDLLAHHLHKWVAVYGDGIVVIRDDMQSIRDAVPDEELATAAMQYITTPLPRIL